MSCRSFRFAVLQVRRIETLAIATAVDREVRPVLSPALPEAHDSRSSLLVSRSDDGSGLCVDRARADEVFEVRREIAHGAAEAQEPWSLPAMTPGAQRGYGQPEQIGHLALRERAGNVSDHLRVHDAAPVCALAGLRASFGSRACCSSHASIHTGFKRIVRRPLMRTWRSSFRSHAV